MRLRLSFQSWILGGCLLVVVCTLALIVLFLDHALRMPMVDTLHETLQQSITVISELAADRVPEDSDIAEWDALAEHLGDRLNMRVTFIALDGRVLGDSMLPAGNIPQMENHADRPEFLQAVATGRGWSLRRSATLGEDLLYVAALHRQEGRPDAVIRLALSVEQVDATLERANRMVLWASLLGVALSLIVAFLVAHRLSHPVRALTNSALNIANGDLDERPRLHRYPSHEIGDLGRAFDQMADHLQEEIEAVTRSRDRLETILGSMVEGVLVTDGTGRITMTNEALSAMLSIKADPVGRMPSEILRNAVLIEALQQVFNGNPYVSTEIRTLGAPQRTLQLDVVPLSGRGVAGGVVAVFHDITERQALDNMRRDFVANVSHELRTPLSAIRAAVETLLDGALQDPRFSRQFSEVIQRHVLRLQDIVEDLLNLARLENRDETPLRKDALDAAGMARVALETVSAMAEKRRVAVSLELPEEPARLSGDSQLLEQALVNLLDNAVKYTEPGGSVSLRVAGRPGEVEFAVRDTGIGIPREHLPRIFERFYRVDKNRSRDMGGTGLGLSIVKHVAQRHGGRVEVDSLPGRGSTFRLIIPA